MSHRNNQSVCHVSSLLYLDLPRVEACSCDNCRCENSEHLGVFLVKKVDIDEYLKKFKPMQLRWSADTKGYNASFPVMNMGESKGLSFDRVLIYPTGAMEKFIKGDMSKLKDTSKAKFYVAITRAYYSVAIVFDYKYDEHFENFEKYSP